MQPRPNGPGERKRPHPLRWLLLALGPVVLVVILLKLDLAALLDSLREARPTLLLAAAAVMLPTVALRTVRWRLLLGDAGAPPMRYRDLLAVYAYSVFVGVATPGRIGEFVKTYHLTRGGMSFGGATATVLLDRLFDIALLLTIGVVALIALAVPGFDSLPQVVGLVAVVIALAVAAGWLFCSARMEPKWSRLAAKDSGRFGRALGRVARIRGDFCVALAGVSLGSFAISLSITVVAWAVTYLANYLLAISIGFELGYLQIVGISAIASLVSQLPITVLGAGTRDAAMILLLAPLGASTEQAVALSTLFLGITLFTGLACAISIASPATRTKA
jgi:uncharacterized protein (TIRG00374 family)